MQIPFFGEFFLDKTKPTEKECFRTQNVFEVEKSISEILKNLESIPTDSLSFHAESALSIFDGSFKKTPVKMFLNSVDDDMYPQIELSITSMSTYQQVAKRAYYFRIDPDANMYYVTSDLRISDDSFQGMHLGSALLHQGERIKLWFAREIQNVKKMQRVKMHSLLIDTSDPPKWTTISAIALGYTRVPKKNNENLFERIDDLSAEVTPVPRLSDTWGKQKRYLFPQLFRRLQILRKK